MHIAKRPGSGFRHRLPSRTEGVATQASSAAALSQTPRLNKTVFLKEMTFIRRADAPRVTPMLKAFRRERIACLDLAGINSALEP